MSLEEYIKELGLTDMQGRVLLYGDNVTSIYHHFSSGEIVGVADYDDGYGVEFVVRVNSNELHNVGSHALQLISRRGQ